MEQTPDERWITLTPLVIAGILLVLAPLFSFMTYRSIHAQKADMERILLEKGDSLIRTFEAGSRTGFIMNNWGGPMVQRLVVETASPEDITYITITDREGVIVACSDPEAIDSRHITAPDPDQPAEQSRSREIITPEGLSVFEVSRPLAPQHGRLTVHLNRGAERDWFSLHMYAAPETEEPPQYFIFVGLDPAPLVDLQTRTTRRTIILDLVLLLAAILGIWSLLLFQGYRQGRRSLSQERAFSAGITTHMPVGLLSLDEAGLVSTLNATGETLLQMDAGEVLGRPGEQVMPPQMTCLLDGLSAEKPLMVRELDLDLADEATVPLEVSATLLHDEHGTFLGHVLLLRDLSEVRELKREVERSERLASLGSLAAGIAHEIRNPLSSIKGFATYFRDRQGADDQDRATAEIMIGEVERLNRVITDLLEFARPMELGVREVSCGHLLADIAAQVEIQAGKRDITVTTELPDDLTCRLDADRMRQVLLNLCLNAVEAMEDGGALTLELSRTASGRVKIQVWDTGCGIPEDDLSHIFDPYYTTKPTGTGLGLAIVHKIVEAHGGEIRAASTQGEGTCMTVLLPGTKEH